MYDSFQTASWLLLLPDSCLLAVLRCCADDPRSLFSAARAQSRLHQAAVLAVSSIRAGLLQQQQANSMIQYLSNYGQNVSSLQLGFCGHNQHERITLRELPNNKLQGLSSLSCSNIHLQLQPGGGFQGVLEGAAPIEQLRFKECRLLDGDKGLTAALLLLTELQHLSLVENRAGNSGYLGIPCCTQQMQQLTYLELVGVTQLPNDLQHLQGLTRLQDLRLECLDAHIVQANMLSGMQHLSRFEVGNFGFKCDFEPGALAGKTMLQHLRVARFGIVGGSAGAAELLSHLQHMQQLTHLYLGS
jgi:hypothetical protein